MKPRTFLIYVTSFIALTLSGLLYANKQSKQLDFGEIKISKESMLKEGTRVSTEYGEGRIIGQDHYSGSFKWFIEIEVENESYIVSLNPAVIKAI